MAEAKINVENVLALVKDDMDIAADSETAFAREIIANRIVAAYNNVAMHQKNDMVSFVFLSELALLTLYKDVQKFLGSKKHIGGFALTLVMDFVATGMSSRLPRKANAVKHTLTRNKSNETKVVETLNSYRKKMYRGFLPKFEREAVMADEGINAGPNVKWAVKLEKIATDVASFRKLDYEKIEEIFNDDSFKPSDIESINNIFAGILGGGKVPHGRRNLVKSGLSVKDACELESRAKSVRITTNNLVGKYKNTSLTKSFFSPTFYF